MDATSRACSAPFPDLVRTPRYASSSASDASPRASTPSAPRRSSVMRKSYLLDDGAAGTLWTPATTSAPVVLRLVAAEALGHCVPPIARYAPRSYAGAVASRPMTPAGAVVAARCGTSRSRVPTLTAHHPSRVIVVADDATVRSARPPGPLEPKGQIGCKVRDLFGTPQPTRIPAVCSWFVARPGGFEPRSVGLRVRGSMPELGRLLRCLPAGASAARRAPDLSRCFRGAEVDDSRAERERG